jgi:hypothetical protein
MTYLCGVSLGQMAKVELRSHLQDSYVSLMLLVAQRRLGHASVDGGRATLIKECEQPLSDGQRSV